MGKTDGQKLKIEYLSLDEIKPYGNNPRKNDGAVDALANSIKEFGFKQPIIIDDSGVIVCGHTRYKAAKKLGLTEIPCIKANDLTPEQLKAFRLADNKTAELAEWDIPSLEMELEALTALDFDMTEFGFEKEDKEATPETPEVEFTESLEEDHNYVVLFFTNKVDFLQAETLFDIKPVKNLWTSKKGKRSTSNGVGRVIDGAKALQKLGVLINENNG